MKEILRDTRKILEGEYPISREIKTRLYERIVTPTELSDAEARSLFVQEERNLSLRFQKEVIK